MTVTAVCGSWRRMGPARAGNGGKGPLRSARRRPLFSPSFSSWPFETYYGGAVPIASVQVHMKRILRRVHARVRAAREDGLDTLPHEALDGILLADPTPRTRRQKAYAAAAVSVRITQHACHGACGCEPRGRLAQCEHWVWRAVPLRRRTERRRTQS